MRSFALSRRSLLASVAATAIAAPAFAAGGPGDPIRKLAIVAAAAGLWVLACLVTVIHFVIAYLFAFITAHLPRAQDVRTQLEIVYRDGRGLLRDLLQSITAGGWSVLRAVPHRTDDSDTAALSLELVGTGDAETLVASLTALDGVHSVTVLDDDDLE